MKEIINKLIAIERETSAEKGDYNLFALLLREDSPDKWDILVSANWITSKEEALQYLAHKIQVEFTENELFFISRIVIIEDAAPAILSLQQSIVDAEHGFIEIKDSAFFGVQIKHAYFIAAKRTQAA